MFYDISSKEREPYFALDWEVLDLWRNELTLKVDFAFPMNISTGQIRDEIEVRINNTMQVLRPVNLINGMKNISADSQVIVHPIKR